MAAKASRFRGSARAVSWEAKNATMVDRVAAHALAGDHGTLHRPGDRPDLCPACNPEVNTMLLAGKVPARATQLAVKRQVRAKAAAKRAAKSKSETKPAKAPRAPTVRREPRSPRGKKRTRLLATMCTDTERDVLVAAAERAGLPFSTWSRRALLREVGGERS